MLFVPRCFEVSKHLGCLLIFASACFWGPTDDIVYEKWGERDNGLGGSGTGDGGTVVSVCVLHYVFCSSLKS